MTPGLWLVTVAAMKAPFVRAALATAAISWALEAVPSQALAPVVALLAKHSLQDMVTTTAKSMPS